MRQFLYGKMIIFFNEVHLSIYLYLYMCVCIAW